MATARGWLMWGLPTSLFLLAFLHRAAPGVFARELMQAFSVTGATVGLLSATYFYAYAGLMLPAGVLLDGVGVRWVVAAGGAVMGGGTLLMASSEHLGPLFVGRLLVGAGAAVTFVGALKIAANWFPPALFATLSALTAAMGILGGLVGTAPLAWVATATGWRGALGAVGLLTVGGAGLCAAFVRDHPGGSATRVTPPPGLRQVLAGLGRVLANPHTWPPFLAFFFQMSANQNLLLWTVSYLRDVYGLHMADAALYATAPSLALLVAAPLTGYLSDRILRRRKLPYTVLTAALVVGWVVLGATAGRLPLGGVYALLLAMGLSGAGFVLIWPLGCELNPPALAGVAVAAVNLGGFVGIALTQGPLGALLDAGWAGAMAEGARVYPVAAYRATFAACAALVLAACVTSLFFRETRGRNVYREPPVRAARSGLVS